jgi:hypothetical protein
MTDRELFKIYMEKVHLADEETIKAGLEYIDFLDREIEKKRDLGWLAGEVFSFFYSECSDLLFDEDQFSERDRRKLAKLSKSAEETYTWGWGDGTSTAFEHALRDEISFWSSLQEKYLLNEIWHLFKEYRHGKK